MAVCFVSIDILLVLARTASLPKPCASLLAPGRPTPSPHSRNNPLKSCCTSTTRQYLLQTMSTEPAHNFAETLLKAEELNPEKRIYTGVGSRETPVPILTVITTLAKVLAQRGWVLRSGGAHGADSAFETGCDQAGGRKEIYLPWKGFNGNQSALFLSLPRVGNFDSIAGRMNDKRAVALAVQFHPLKTQLFVPSHKMRTVLKLMARNSQQILGESVSEENKTGFVICCTPQGQPIGGTRQAIVLAHHFQIPVFNLGNIETLRQISAFLQ